jgi:DNA-binding NarL/FixJ family response regulator
VASVRTNVFIVDDHELIRAALRESLRTQSDLFIVGEAGTAKEALKRILLVAPDVALLDVRLPDGNGVELCRAIRAENPKVCCLMLSQESEEEIVTNAVLAGASGFLRKDIGVEGLVDAIRRVAAGESLLTFETLQATLLKLRGNDDEVDDDESLTETEQKVLDLIADGMTNREIADRLALAEQTVKNYVSRILTKLGMKRRTEAALYAAKRRNA